MFIENSRICVTSYLLLSTIIIRSISTLICLMLWGRRLVSPKKFVSTKFCFGENWYDTITFQLSLI